ncbi:hypothetical protein ACEQPO_08585 [Bacillus sp. SL00103]
MLESLQQRDLLTGEQVQSINQGESLLSSLLQLVQKTAAKSGLVKREVSFSMWCYLLKEVYSHIDTEGEPVLIQGMIDCLFETDGKLYLLDL